MLGSCVPLLALVVASLPLFACGGEGEDAPPPSAPPRPTVSAPVAVVDAAPPAPLPPLRIEISVADRSVRTRLAVPAPVPIDAATLTLPPALRGVVARQLAAQASVESLFERASRAKSEEIACGLESCPRGDRLRVASAAASDALSKGVASYRAIAPHGIAVLAAAADDPDHATTDIALASALLLRRDRDLVDSEAAPRSPCIRDVVDDDALHVCGDTDARLAHAFARALALSAPSDPLGVVARRGVAQTASASVGRAALEPVLDTVSGSARVAVLQDLAVADLSGPSPDYGAAAAVTRELLALLDKSPKPTSNVWPPPGSAPDIHLASAASDSRVLYLSPRRALDAAVFCLLFALSRTNRDHETVDAAVDLFGRQADLRDLVATLAADAVERSDDVAIAKAPTELRRAVFELLAARALYRGDLSEAHQWATLADAAGGSGPANDVLAAQSTYGKLPKAPLPPTDRARLLDPDDLHLASTSAADAGRRLASLFRLCTEPFGGRLGDHPHLTLSIAPSDDGGAPSVEIAGNLPGPIGDCMRQRAVPALVRLPQGVVADVTLARIASR